MLLQRLAPAPPFFLDRTERPSPVCCLYGDEEALWTHSSPALRGWKKPCLSG